MATKSDRPEEKPPVVTEERVDSSKMGDLADRQNPDAVNSAEEGPNNVVRYTGVVTERHITKADWEQAGVDDQEGVVWTRDTGHTLPTESFSEGALALLRQQGDFAVIQRDDQ
jgi:hypothetical protein